MINEEFYDLVYRLEYLIRYSNVPRIHDESVASHSFFVSVILIDLNDRYEFDLGKATIMAICHDMPETRTNDLSHETQSLYPKLKEALREAEVEAIKEFPEACQHAITEYTLCESVESKFVHLADAMQCYQYACHELKLGNDGYMQEVVLNSLNRIKQLFKLLNEYERDAF